MAQGVRNRGVGLPRSGIVCNPRYRAPRQDVWNSDTPLHAAFVAQGQALCLGRKPPPACAGRRGRRAACRRTGLRAPKMPWRSWLKLDGQPSPLLPILQRVALVGGAAILAAQNDFLLAGLYPHRINDVFPLNLGSPLAQVAAEGWWIGWSRQAGRPALWLAPVPASWRQLDPQLEFQATPDGSVPQERRTPGAARRTWPAGSAKTARSGNWTAAAALYSP